MLLVIDVGNTNITLGIFDGEKVSGTFRMKSKQPRTSDEYGIMLRELVERHGVAGKDIQDMLPAIEIRKPASILAKETISSMQGGLLYGQIGQTEYIVKRLKEESGYTDAKVVATGGLGKMIVSDTDVVDVYDPQLTLKGLRIIFEKNKKR